MELERQTQVWLDLQLFSGEKTEEATPKRREDARKKGQIARSVEINSALVLIAVFAGFKMYGSYLYEQSSLFMQTWFLRTAAKDFTIEIVYQLFLECMLVFVKLAFPVMLTALIVGLVCNYAQVGFLFSTETLRINLNVLNPISGFQRIFSKKAFADLVKSLGKIGLIGYIAFTYIIDQITLLPKLMQSDLRVIFQTVGNMTFWLVMKVGLVIGILAVFDFIFQHWEYNQSLKMSKQDIKDEYKQTEGDPKVKAKIKERQRMMAMRRMMQEVPKADVIITNPTHFAIALKYDIKTMGAPIVIAKGQDLVAKRIKEIAAEHGVMTVENKPLAQTLFKTTEIGEVIPADLYQAVAEILAYVYRLKRRA